MRSTPRIELLSRSDAAQAAQAAGVPPHMAELSAFRVLLRHPELCLAVFRLLGFLLFRGRLDKRLRELVIMRIGWVSKSEYEWAQHWRVATKLGIEAEDLLAVRDWRSCARFGAAERAVLAATDEMLASGKISDETWRACQATLHDPQLLIELVVAIGNWHLFSSLLRSLEVPLEEGVAPWPPDGRSP